MSLLLISPDRSTASEDAAYFDCETQSWNASAIAIVRLDDADSGRCTVLEQFDGALQVEQPLHLPGLPARPEGSEVAASRLLVFLRRQADAWAPVFGQEWRTTTVWLQAEEIVTHRRLSEQVFEAYSLRFNEFMLLDQVRRICEHKTAYHQARAVDDPRQRAAALIALLPIYIADASEGIYRSLRDCGTTAEAEVLAAVERQDLRDHRPAFLHLLGKIGGEGSRQMLRATLQSEYSFWYRHAIDLPPEWWRDDRLPYHDRKLLRDRIDYLQQSLLALLALEDTEADELVLRLGAFWRTVPHLANQRFGGVAELCESYLAAQALEALGLQTAGGPRH